MLQVGIETLQKKGDKKPGVLGDTDNPGKSASQMSPCPAKITTVRMFSGAIPQCNARTCCYKILRISNGDIEEPRAFFLLCVQTGQCMLLSTLPRSAFFDPCRPLRNH
jgi:hypothetical protein